MSRAENKANRLLQIEALLLAHPEGLTQAELARCLEVNRSTVNRYFRDMPNQFPYYENENGRLFIDRQLYLVNVRLDLHEAMAVHLASRLLATRMDRQNPHATSSPLGDIIPVFSGHPPGVGIGMKIERSALREGYLLSRRGHKKATLYLLQ